MPLSLQTMSSPFCCLRKVKGERRGQRLKLTLCPLSDVYGSAAETQCRKIRGLRGEDGRNRIGPYLDPHQRIGTYARAGHRKGGVRSEGGAARLDAVPGIDDGLVRIAYVGQKRSQSVVRQSLMILSSLPTL